MTPRRRATRLRARTSGGARPSSTPLAGAKRGSAVKGRLLKIAIIAFGAVTLLGIAAVSAFAIVGWVVYQREADTLGDVSQLITQNFGPARIYDRNNNLLYEFEDRDGLRENVSVSKVSPWVVRATTATEDASFYSNPGVNIRGLLRAGIENFFPGKGDFLQGSGGSSITQQLVKNVLIPAEDRYDRNYDRKLKEAVLAVELTRRYSKDQIMEWYLNQIYYGNRAYGIGAAAQRYFGVSADTLDLAQASLLVGIPQAPLTYDPLLNYEAAKARQNQVLDLMVRHHQATPQEADAARAEPLNLVQRNDYSNIRAPHWVFYIQDELVRRFGEASLYRSGLKVYTTLDLELQEKGQEIVNQWVTEFEKQNCGCHNGALVAIDNNTGQILAMVGSRDFFNKDIQGEVNNAIALKEPGSAFKPAVYLTAFMKGWSPSTIVWDVPKKYPNPGGKDFIPVGPTTNYNGPVTVRQALGSSLNAPAVATAEYAGVRNVIDTAHKLGISTLNDPENYGVSIATGGANITLLDMTYMYSTIANNGVIVGAPTLEARPRALDPVSILKVTNAQGRTVYEFKEPRREQAVPPQFAYLITDVLKDDSARRLIYPAGIFDLNDHRPLAAKTGTQQGYEVSQIRSTWNFGYVPRLSVGVWVGNADGTLVRNISSASSSLRIWRDFMQYAVDYLGIPPEPFVQPQGITRGAISVPGGGTCRAIDDLFLSARAPAPQPSATGTAAAAAPGPCRTVKIDTRNNLLAGPDTPPEFVKEVTYVELPPGLDGWTPGPDIRVGTPPAETSTITPTPTPTRAPTLPPRVVTAAPSVTSPSGSPTGPSSGSPTPSLGTPGTLPPRAVTPPPTTPRGQPGSPSPPSPTRTP